MPACRELGIKILAYSPLGRGFLTGGIRSTDILDAYDFRSNHFPRTSKDNIAKNLALVDNLKNIADHKGITVGQLALAWVHNQGEDVIPIPGTTSLEHLQENIEAAKVTLSPADLKAIDELFPTEAVVGSRYADMSRTFHGNANHRP